MALLLLPKMKTAFLVLPKMKMNGLSKICVLSVFIFYKHSIFEYKYFLRLKFKFEFKFKFKFKFPAFCRKSPRRRGLFLQLKIKI